MHHVIALQLLKQLIMIAASLLATKEVSEKQDGIQKNQMVVLQLLKQLIMIAASRQEKFLKNKMGFRKTRWLRYIAEAIDHEWLSRRGPLRKQDGI